MTSYVKAIPKTVWWTSCSMYTLRSKSPKIFGMLWRRNTNPSMQARGNLLHQKFLNFVMVDSRPIMEQVHELQLIFQEIADEDMKLCETFTVNCFIEKLPPSQEDFKNYLVYKQNTLTLAHLITRLQSESLKRDKDGPFRSQDNNVAEYWNKGKRKARFQKSVSKRVQKASSSFKRQAQPSMKNKFGRRCGSYGKMGYK